MNQESNEQRWTAYVFGELSPTEKQRCETELRQSPELQRQVQAIRDAVAAVELELSADEISVDERARQKITSAIKPSAAPPSVVLGDQPIDHRRQWKVAVTVAAALLVLTTLWASTFVFKEMDNNAVELAGKTTDVNEDALQSLVVVSDGSDESDAMLSDFYGTRLVEIEEAVVPGNQLLASGGGGEASLVTAERLSAANTQNAKAEEIAKFNLAQNDLLERVERERIRANDQLGSEVKATPRPSGGRVLERQSSLPAGSARGGYGFSDDLDFARGGQPVSELARNSRALESVSDLLSILEKEPAGGMRGSGVGMGDFAMEGFGDPSGASATRGVMDSMEQETLDAFGRASESHELLNRGDRFEPIVENPFRRVTKTPMSTFSIDVDTAAYAKVRMYLMQHRRLPDPNAVRIEELLNYFTYDYAPPTDKHPFAAHVAVAPCPWNPDNRLARVALKGKTIQDKRPASNLVFLLDVSGSMNEPNKLPLVIDGMKMLTRQLTENDMVSIVVYAGAAGMVLPPTCGEETQTIIQSLERLHAGGSTAGAQGIQLAYELARDNFIVGGTNRVILCSDGDFNVGVTNTDQLVEIAKENAKGNIFLSVLGFGMGNHNDAMMEQISNKGNGNYAFIDTKSEAQKVLVKEMGGTLVTIAKDVKIQIEFNPKEVESYRLIGYENRILQTEDFDDDKKDAGEIGAGHTVTALYELKPSKGKASKQKPIESDLRYQKGMEPSKAAKSGELFLLKLRYKQPTGTKSTLMEFPIKDEGKKFSQMDNDFKFASSVAQFGMLLRGSKHKGNATLEGVAETATASAAEKPYRLEFVQMVNRLIELTTRK